MPVSPASSNMRALVLLCLLHAVFGQPNNKYIWNPSNPVTQNPVEETSEPQMCPEGQASCGCCLMQRNIERMRSHFYYVRKEMKYQLAKTKWVINDIKGDRSAFSAALNAGGATTCYGPFSNDQIILYNHVFVNMGSAYSAQSGVFTAPRSGVYSLAVTIYTTAHSGSMSACARLQVNGKDVGNLLEKNNHDVEDSASIIVTVKLQAQDKVAVMMPAGCFLCNGSGHFNTFTGFLLHHT